MTHQPVFDFSTRLSSGQQEQLREYLAGFVTPRRLERLNDRLQFRTRHITVVLENIFQSHNASAVLRSADCFGIQDIYFLEDRNPYQINPDVALGSSKWLTIHRPGASNLQSLGCLEELKRSGYMLIATSPHLRHDTPESLPLDQKIALMFGTELEGLSDPLLEMADGFVRIPMVGFTESLNISVSAAILLYTLSNRLRRSNIPWQLNEEEKLSLFIGWLLQTIPKSNLLLRDYLLKNGIDPLEL